MKVCLVGNANTGKTTLFNTLACAHEHVGNWHGVTVEEKVKTYKFMDKKIELVDLPGIYSLTPLSFEEKVARDFLLKESDAVVVNICDEANLSRNLYLTLCLMEKGGKVILAVNRMSKRPHSKIDYSKLSQSLGMEVVSLDASKRSDCARLNKAIVALEGRENQKFQLPYLKQLFLGKTFPKNFNDYQKIKFLEGDAFVEKTEKQGDENVKKIEKQDDVEIEKLEKQWSEGVEKIASARYEYIDKVLAECIISTKGTYGKSKLDKILLNKFLAFPIFLCFIALAFYLTFFSIGKFLGESFGGMIDMFIAKPIENICLKNFGDGAVTNFIADGLLGGVSSIMSFLPQVALLFFFLSVLEDSGYLSRVAFLFEDVLGKIGLSGKSVYTLLMGFGCSTTAVLTARNMEDKNSKIKTALLSPYMSCSAKFPVYAVVGGAFFGAKNLWVILGLYALGVIVAITLSCIFEKTVLKSKRQSFILEFPPYRMMSLKRTISLLWQNVKMFMVRVGSLIMVMNMLIWLLSSFAFPFHYVGGGGVSMLETLGRILSPIFAPLGFSSWAIVSALIAGFVAKEVILSSIALFNGTASNALLGASLLLPTSAVYFASGASVLSFLVFTLLYFPCLASFAVLIKEIGAKWAWLGAIVEFLTAYSISLLTFFMASLIEKSGVGFAIIVAVALIVALTIFMFKKSQKKGCPYGRNCSGCEKNNH